MLLRAERDRESAERTLILDKAKDDIEGPLFDYELRRVVLGMDADDEIVSSCVVVPRPHQPKTTIVKEGKSQLIFRATFDATKGEDGTAPLQGVKSELKRMWPATSDDPKQIANAKRNALFRALEKLPSGFEIIEKGGIEYVQDTASRSVTP